MSTPNRPHVEPAVVDRFTSGDLIGNYYQHTARTHTIMVIVPIAHPWSQLALFAKRDRWTAYDGADYLRLPNGRLAVAQSVSGMDEQGAREMLNKLIILAQDSDGPSI